MMKQTREKKFVSICQIS